MVGWSKMRSFRSAVVLAALVVSFPKVSRAFYEVYKGDRSLELRGNIRMNATQGRQPAIQGVPPDLVPRGTHGAGALLRGMLDATMFEGFSMELHVFQLVSAAGGGLMTNRGGQVDGFALSEAGRSALFRWRAYERGGTFTELAVDRLNFRLDYGIVQLTVGRQPVNLGSTYYFTPNDLFGAFAAQTFFRVYKPGVDAARLELQLSELTQATIVGVLGYDRGGQEAAWDDRPSWEESAVIARVFTTLWGFEWAALGGKAPGRYLVGGSLQGELFSWLGVRAAGHYNFSTESEEGLGDRAVVALALEHRFENSLHLRLEQFYNGGGVSDAAQYLGLLFNPRSPLGSGGSRGPQYLGEHYTALGGSYEVTPLLNMDALVLVNWSDRSVLASLYAVYSLSDEIEFSLSVLVPIGASPRVAGGQLSLRSEFGAAPLSVISELRAYF